MEFRLPDTRFGFFPLPVASFCFGLSLLFAACNENKNSNADVGIDAGVDTGVDTGPVDAGPPLAWYFVPESPEETRPVLNAPWPTDLRKTADDRVDVRTFPNPKNSSLLANYLTHISGQQKGFGTNGSLYFPLSHAPDPSTVAEETSATDWTSNYGLVDLTDGASLGQRIPTRSYIQTHATMYWTSPTLAIRPLQGMPLLPGHTYGFYLLRNVRTADGRPFGLMPDMEALLSGSSSGRFQKPQEQLTRLTDVLAAHAIAREQILSFGVFTTDDVVSDLFALAEHARNVVADPTFTANKWTKGPNGEGFEEVRGEYGPLPIYQEGVIPYQTEGGRISFNAEGTPIVQGTYSARFSLTVPTTAMPATGYPLVLYSHGTGGDYRSFIEDGTAQRLASNGIAVMGIDQIHHGNRNPTAGGPDLLFFNIFNPDSVRTNSLQAAVDVVMQARAAKLLAIPLATLKRNDASVLFETSHMGFFGHSQGGLTGPLYLAVDDSAKVALISEGGALLPIALLEKTEPTSIPALVPTLLLLPGNGGQESLDLEGFVFEHPVCSLLQMWIDSSDGANYGRFLVSERPAALAPLHILFTEGLLDTYTTPHSIEALAMSARMPIVGIVAQEPEAYRALGLQTLALPVNRNLGGGTVTAGLIQFPRGDHFLVFDDPTAQTVVRNFLRSIVDKSVPIIF